MSQAQTSTAHVDDVICKIVDQVAEAEGVDPVELTPPLFEIIDVDALSRLFDPTPTTGQMGGRVTFSYKGYEITVQDDDVVEVASPGMAP